MYKYVLGLAYYIMGVFFVYGENLITMDEILLVFNE